MLAFCPLKRRDKVHYPFSLNQACRQIRNDFIFDQFCEVLLAQLSLVDSDTTRCPVKVVSLTINYFPNGREH